MALVADHGAVGGPGTAPCIMNNVPKSPLVGIGDSVEERWSEFLDLDNCLEGEDVLMEATLGAPNTPPEGEQVKGVPVLQDVTPCTCPSMLAWVWVFRRRGDESRMSSAIRFPAVACTGFATKRGLITNLPSPSIFHVLQCVLGLLDAPCHIGAPY